MTLEEGQGGETLALAQLSRECNQRLTSGHRHGGPCSTKAFLANWTAWAG